MVETITDCCILCTEVHLLVCSQKLFQLFFGALGAGEVWVGPWMEANVVADLKRL